MARRSRIAPPLPEYTVSSTGDQFHVTNRLSGYTFSGHPDHEAAQQAAQRLTTEPEAAVTAARALFDALPAEGPALVRRFRALALNSGYRWTVPYGQAVIGLFGSDGYRYGSDRELKELTSAGLLSEIWDTAGAPYLTTPERFRELPVTWPQTEGEPVPTAAPAMLGRRRARLEAMTDAERNERCDIHSRFVTTCCPPVEEWECDWAWCRANAVTTVHDRGAARHLCHRCAISHYFPRMRRYED